MGRRTRVATVAFALTVACAAGVRPAAADGEVLPSCEAVRHAVVTDIDETLTTSDAEMWRQFLDPGYDPLQRADAATMMAAYAAKGYWIVYVTARPEQLRLPNGRSERVATRDWLVGHGFPQNQDRTLTYLAPDVLSGLLPRGYKGEVVQALQGQGFTIDFAYGNAKTDFQAFADAAVPLDRTFSIGELAGWGGTVPVPDGTYTAHVADHVATVAPVCDPEATPPGPAAACVPVGYDNLFTWLFEQWLSLSVTPHTLACH